LQTLRAKQQLSRYAREASSPAGNCLTAIGMALTPINELVDVTMASSIAAIHNRQTAGPAFTADADV
jgi:hypothetical protein